MEGPAEPLREPPAHAQGRRVMGTHGIPWSDERRAQARRRALDPRRILDRVEYEPNTGCWLWAGAWTSKGYGVLKHPDDASNRASRASWRLFRGPIPSGELVCHRCDTPQCVNPDHLFLGTHSDNTRDAVRKGRWHQLPPRNTKLTAADARRIVERRARGESVRSIAEDLGTSETAVGNVLNGRTWRSETGVEAKPVHRAPTLTWGGETLTIGAWAARLGVHRGVVVDRLRRGWSLDRALTAPREHQGGRRVTCPRGHPYDAENTAIDIRGAQVCRICRRDSTSRWRAAKKAAGGERGGLL